MADKKISQLTTLAQADVAVTADFLPIVDTSATETKKATPQSVVLGALGATSANVGIGTASPGARLEVSGSVTTTADVSGLLTLGRFSAGYPWSLIRPSSGSSGFEFRSFAGTAWLNIDTSGNLGIGTASPAQKLTVAGGSVLLDNSYYYYGKNAAGTAVRLLGVNSGNVNYVGSIDSGPTEVNYGAASTITAQYWNISGSEGMRLTSTGLGIGTASPLSRLNVAGTTGLTWGGPGDSSALVTIGTQGTAGGSLFVNTASINSSFASGLAIDGTYSSFSSVVNIKALGVKSGGGYGSSIAFHTSSNTALNEQMRLTAAGDLGIGTASPTSKVEVYGGAAGTSTNLTVGNANTAFLFGVDTSNNCQIRTAQNVPMIFYTNATNRGGVDGAGNWTLGGGTLATSATDGFFYVPTCAGTPTGTPTTKTGFAPIVVNTTNNKLYFYSGGAWRDAGP